jgi:hypothetical protein
MNLLTSKKGKEAINKYSENKSKTTTMDFIIKYTTLAFGKVFDKNFSEIDSDKLKEAYLYFLFQIKDSENIKKLKLLIYEYLYEKPDINEFIKKSSIEIAKKGGADDTKLRNYEFKYFEFNISINNVQNNINLFFGEDLKKNISNLLNFFNPNNILNNKIYTDDVKLEGDDSKIVIDDLNYKKDKIHLFSTEFLVVNGLKSKIYENDFQIFNDNNYSIDLFAKFLRKIILEINESILKNNFENDFLKKHLIKLNTKMFYHFISAKLFNADKDELNKEKNENNIKNPLIKIRMYQEKNAKKKSKENSNKNLNEKSASISAAYSEEIKNKSDDLEYIINTLLTDNFKEDELISIPNILFMLNLKIPKFNQKRNSIEFSSAYLDYTNKETKLENENFCYGFKEIDAEFRSNSKNFINVKEFEFFTKNLKYIKENNEKNFKYKNDNDKIFAIYPNSFFFL